MAWCVLVKGHCRGRNCDYWARVRLRKMTSDEVFNALCDGVHRCMSGHADLDSAMEQYWSEFGLRDRVRLSREDSELHDKLRAIEERLRVSFRGQGSCCPDSVTTVGR